MLDVPLIPKAASIPPHVDQFLQEAERRMESCDKLSRIPGFVPSDYCQVYHALTSIAAERTAPGNLFCEWGSGFGVVTCLAALTGFHAWGIEIEPELVNAARLLASDFSLDVNFYCDSYLPREFTEVLDIEEPSLYLVAQAGEVRETWGLGPEDFDLIYAYPGPDDDHTISKFFGRYGSSGATLLTYHGRDGLRLRRKVRRRSKSSRR